MYKYNKIEYKDYKNNINLDLEVDTANKKIVVTCELVNSTNSPNNYNIKISESYSDKIFFQNAIKEELEREVNNSIKVNTIYNNNIDSTTLIEKLKTYTFETFDEWKNAYNNLIVKQSQIKVLLKLDIKEFRDIKIGEFNLNELSDVLDDNTEGLTLLDEYFKYTYNINTIPEQEYNAAVSAEQTSRTLMGNKKLIYANEEIKYQTQLEESNRLWHNAQDAYNSQIIAAEAMLGTGIAVAIVTVGIATAVTAGTTAGYFAAIAAAEATKTQAFNDYNNRNASLASSLELKRQEVIFKENEHNIKLQELEDARIAKNNADNLKNKNKYNNSITIKEIQDYFTNEASKEAEAIFNYNGISSQFDITNIPFFNWFS